MLTLPLAFATPTITFLEPTTSTHIEEELTITIATSTQAELCYANIGSRTKILHQEQNHYLRTITQDDGIYTLRVSCLFEDQKISEEKILRINTQKPRIEEIQQRTNGLYVQTNTATTCLGQTKEGTEELQTENFLEHHTENTDILSISCTDSHNRTITQTIQEEQETNIVPDNNLITGQVIQEQSSQRSSYWYLLALLFAFTIIGYYVFIQREEQESFLGAPRQTLEQTPVTETFLPRTQNPRRLDKPIQHDFFTRKTTNKITPTTMMYSSHEHINNKNYDMAKKLYQTIILQKHHHKMTSKEQQELNVVYNKLLLYKLVAQAKKAQEEGNAQTIAQKLTMIKQLAHKIPYTQTRLMNDTIKEYNTLKEEHNRLLIEQETL